MAPIVNAVPDQYGWNHLGLEVACIDCNVRGPRSDWPVKRRQQHQLAHQKEQRKAAERAARQRAREALRLKKQKDRENALVYKEGAND